MAGKRLERGDLAGLQLFRALAQLDPEQAKGWEAGAEQRLFDGKLAFGASYFERKTTGQIIFNSCTTTSTRVPDKRSSPTDEPRAVRAGEELDAARLAAYLRERLTGVEGEVEIRQFPAGFSKMISPSALFTSSGRCRTSFRPSTVSLSTPGPRS